MPLNTLTNEALLELESRQSFQFFWEEANGNRESSGYGLIPDKGPNQQEMCSIASVGFGLTALIIGAERKWVTQEEVYERAVGTLHTLLHQVEQVHGFFYHFIHFDTGERYGSSEVSIIDTAIAVCGALSIGEYFGGEAKELAQAIYERVNWEWYRDPVRNMFYMGYWPEKGFEGHWDLYAEQLMLYFLAVASPTFPVPASMYDAFGRQYGTYGDFPPFIYTWLGSLFAFQFSYAWFDLRQQVDQQGVSWWENSVIATKVNRQYCIDHAHSFRTFGPTSWGLTACDGPQGYSGRYGAAPSGYQEANDQHHPDGTIPPAGAAGSIVFAPEEVLVTLHHYYEKYPQLWCRYGFVDAYNLDVEPAWYATDVIGIDKGITLVMIENYRTGLVWEVFMKNKFAQEGLRKCGIQHIEGKANNSRDRREST